MLPWWSFDKGTLAQAAQVIVELMNMNGEFCKMVVLIDITSKIQELELEILYNILIPLRKKENDSLAVPDLQIIMMLYQTWNYSAWMKDMK